MKTLIIFSLTFLASCLILQNSSNDIIGKWECYHKELEDGTTKGTDLFSGEEYEYSCNGLIIELKADFTGSESIGGLSFKYEKNDSILKLGDRSYIIELLDKNKLQIRDYSTDKTDLSGGWRRKFKKVK